MNSMIITTNNIGKKSSGYFQFFSLQLNFVYLKKRVSPLSVLSPVRENRYVPHEIMLNIILYLGLKYVIYQCDRFNNSFFYDLCMNESCIFRMYKDDFTSFLVWNDKHLESIIARFTTLMLAKQITYDRINFLIRRMFSTNAHLIISHDGRHDAVDHLSDRLSPGLNNDRHMDILRDYLYSELIDKCEIGVINTYILHNVNCHFCATWDLRVLNKILNVTQFHTFSANESCISFYLTHKKPVFRKKKNSLYGPPFAFGKESLHYQRLNVINRGESSYKWSGVKIPIVAEHYTLDSTGSLDIYSTKNSSGHTAKSITVKHGLDYALQYTNRTIQFDAIRKASTQIIQRTLRLSAIIYDLRQMNPTIFETNMIDNIHLLTYKTNNFNNHNHPLVNKLIGVRSFVRHLCANTMNINEMKHITIVLPTKANLFMEKGDQDKHFVHCQHEYIELQRSLLLPERSFYIRYCFHRTDEIDMSIVFLNTHLDTLTESSMELYEHTILKMIRHNYYHCMTFHDKINYFDRQRTMHIEVNVRDPFVLSSRMYRSSFPYRDMREHMVRMDSREQQLSKELKIECITNYRLLNKQPCLLKTNLEGLLPYHDIIQSSLKRKSLHDDRIVEHSPNHSLYQNVFKYQRPPHLMSDILTRRRSL